MTAKIDPSKTGFTQEIATIVSQMKWTDLPEATRIMARHALLDFFGVMIAGYEEPLASILREQRVIGGASTIFGGDLQTSTRDAALINGATGHALDYDDVSIIGHPTTAILPAALAVGEAQKRSGRDVLLSYVAGYEAASIVASQIQPSHYEKGFHSTGTLGAIGAAAAVANLLQLDKQKTAVAIGLAATQAAGLKAQFGTMAKPLHAGKAASNGVLAAELAAAGFEGREDALEIDQGFFSTQSDVQPFPIGEYIVGQHIQNNLFKHHASCHCTHAMMESLKLLMDRIKVVPAEVEELVVHVPAGYLKVANIQEPETGLESKFSLPQCAALTIAGHDTASIDTFSEQTANDPGLIALRRRVSIVGDVPSSSYMFTHLDLKLKDGTKHQSEYDAGIPEADLALQERKLIKKFESLVRGNLNGRTDTVAQQLLAFDELGTIDNLAEALAD